MDLEADADQARADVLVIGDGWLDAHPADTLQPIL